MSTFARYTHLPLPSSNNIRLLEFPGYTDHNEPLQGTLCVVDLEESSIPYVALSYTWGEPNFSEDILLDGNRIFGITPTLAAALRRFRYASALRWIWVDAICINQQDDAEKTMQIPLMGNIYRGASRVIVLLGVRAEYVDLLHQIKRLMGKTTKPYEDGAIANRLVTDMSQLGRLPWFSRRWIIQKIVLNPNAFLCCGQTEIPWIHLAAAFQAIEHKKTTDLQNIRLLWDLRRELSLPLDEVKRHQMFPDDCLGKRDIATLMMSCLEFECLDDRDRISGLIGISRDGHRTVTVNYADSVEQTFISFAEGLMRSGHMAWLIYQSLQKKKNPSTPGQVLPSWVPDWRATIPIHDQKVKFDIDAYRKIPCDIQMYSASPNLHRFTATFLISGEKAIPSDDSLQIPVNINPAAFQVLWKSVLFSKEADFSERMALTLLDLWPWAMAHLSDDGKTSRHGIWLELLVWVSFFLNYPLGSVSHSPYSPFNMSLPHAVIPNFSQDIDGLNILRSFTRGWVKKSVRNGHIITTSDILARHDCLILCQQTDQPGWLTRGLPCAFGCLQLSFYHAIEIGDTVLWANLGRYHFRKSDYTSSWLHNRHIVREHAAIDGLPVFSGVTSPDSLRGANECAPPQGLPGISKAQGSHKIALPVVYEFVAPCDLFLPFACASITLFRKSQRMISVLGASAALSGPSKHSARH